MIHAERDSALCARILSVEPLRAVRAGSALVWAGGRLLVVQDDALAVAWVDPRSGAVEVVALEGEGEPLSKASKPDFEAAFARPDGSITLLGSGSTGARCRVARIDVATGRVGFTDCTRLFEALAVRLGTRPNIEGAVLEDDKLHLFHRGAGGAASAVAEVRGDALDGREVTRVLVDWVELGTASGVSLAFTDAAPTAGGMLYLAVAEDTPNAIDDGPIAGAAVGVIRAGRARYAILEEADGTPSRRKVEGLALEPATGEAFMVTDPDDPTRPAELCRVALSGY